MGKKPPSQPPPRTSPLGLSVGTESGRAGPRLQTGAPPVGPSPSPAPGRGHPRGLLQPEAYDTVSGRESGGRSGRAAPRERGRRGAERGRPGPGGIVRTGPGRPRGASAGASPLTAPSPTHPPPGFTRGAVSHVPIGCWEAGVPLAANGRRPR